MLTKPHQAGPVEVIGVDWGGGPKVGLGFWATQYPEVLVIFMGEAIVCAPDTCRYVGASARIFEEQRICSRRRGIVIQSL